MEPSWKTDPRLKGLDPAKLELLTRFSEDLKKKPADQILSSLLSLNQQAAAGGLSFTDRETSLIFSILTEHMSPAEQKRARMLKTLAGRLTGRKRPG